VSNQSSQEVGLSRAAAERRGASGANESSNCTGFGARGAYGASLAWPGSQGVEGSSPFASTYFGPFHHEMYAYGTRAGA
jgi:hypothetical protein